MSKKFERGIFVQIYKVVGLNSFNFTNDKGDQVIGSTYHLLSAVPSSSDNFSGYSVEKQSVFGDRLDSWVRSGAYIPGIGSYVLLLYTKNKAFDGFIDAVSVGLFTPPEDEE